MESVKTNEGELTSTMGNLLSSSKDEKNDASDSTPTSSTDAFTTTSTSHIAADDPISSTSSDVLDFKRNDKTNDVSQSFSNNVVNTSPIMSSLKSISLGHHTPSFVSEKDLLDMNITDTSIEKITENVDDIVQDLENLLGEPTTTFDFIRPRETRKDLSHDKELSMDLDDFSVDFQMPEETSKEIKVENKNLNICQTDSQNSCIEDVNKVISRDLKEENLSVCVFDGSMNQSETASASIHIEENKECIGNVNIIAHPMNNTNDIQTNSEDTSIKSEITPECEINTETVEERNLGVSSEKDKSATISSITPIELQATDKINDNAETKQIEKQDENLTNSKNSDALLESVSAEKVEEHTDSIESSNMTNLESLVVDLPQKQFNENDTTSVTPDDMVKSVEDKKHYDEEMSEIISGDDMENIQSSQEENTSSSLKAPQNLVGNTVTKEEREELSEKLCNLVVQHDAAENLPIEEKEKHKQLEDSSGLVTQDAIEKLPVEIEDKQQKNIVDKDITEHQQDQSKDSEEDIDRMPLISEKSTGALGIDENIFDNSMKVDRMNEDQILAPEEKTEGITQIKTSVLGKEAVDSEEFSQSEIHSEAKAIADSCTYEEMDRQSKKTAVINEAHQEISEVKEDNGTTEKTINEHIESIAETRTAIEELDATQSANSSKFEEQQNKELNNTSSLTFAAAESVETLDASQSTEEITETDRQVQESTDYQELTTVSVMEQIKNVENPERNMVDTAVELPPEVSVEVPKVLEAEIRIEVTSEIPEETASFLNENIVEESAIIPTSISSCENLNIAHDNVLSVGAVIAPNIPEKMNENIISEENTVADPSSASIEDFNALDDMVAPNVEANLPEHFEEGDAELPSSSSVDNVKTLTDDVMENNMLPLVMEEVPDIDVLNAISTLNENKPDFIPEMTDNLENNDALLASSTLEDEPERNIGDVAFEPCIGSALPTVDEIFAEQSDQQPVELPDDNLETLLAVASLQNVCESDESYNMAPVDDISAYTQEVPPLKIQDEKIESLFEHKGTFEEPSEQSAVVESANQPFEPISEGTDGQEQMGERTMQHQENKLKEPLVINIDDSEKDRTYSPKITIKPIKMPEEEEEVTSASGEPDEKEGSKGSLKMTITKQSDTMHSILKIYDPEADMPQQQEDEQSQPEPTVPKLIIKPIVQPNEQPQSPKMSTRSSKQVFSPSSSGSQRSASPRITIKPIVKPDNLVESIAPVKITIKPVLKPEERQKHSPKLTIKPIIKPEDEIVSETKLHSPRVTIKPIVKPPDEIEQNPSPRITIKPIVKPESVAEPVASTPRVTIKPVVKPQEREKSAELSEQPVERSSPKITIKPIVKPHEFEAQPDDYEDSIKERIVLKINKGNIPSSTKELRKREQPQEEEKSEKLAKIKLKFSKEGGHPHIVQDESPGKRSLEQAEHDRSKRQKTETESILPGITITALGSQHSKLKEMLSGGGKSTGDRVVTIEDDDDDVTIVEDQMNKPSPIVISEESNQDSINVAMEVRDPISEIPVFEITPDSVKTINPQPVPPPVEVPPTPPAPRKRGRPRKVPLQVREDFKDPKEEEPKPVIESTRPKRSCRGQSVRTTLGIKPRKPRGPGRGRGSKRGMGTRSTPTPTSPEPVAKAVKEPKVSATKLKPLKEDLILAADKTEEKQIEIDDGFHKSPSQSLLAPPHSDNSTTDRADIVMYEEETRMSAETSSRAQTPAKQVVSSIPSVDLVEESQSSVQSTATTESVKVRKGPRLEVHQEPEGAVISADQLAEYYWSGGGPYMLQEQVAQFLGIKSFKRKYPNIPRRVVDMQERDFIRESGLAGEAMCDLGLTAVNSTDILDIMYSDFQDKYEEYCKHQRDRQAKDLTNKQKALSLAASQEKTKMDITQQAVQSAATWNASFNKARRDQRKACMDLQTLTIHFPKGRMKQINKAKIGHYPVALVPGQFTDYYTEFSPTEINNLPFNTLCYDPLPKGNSQEMECESQTDGSGSESDSSTSDSDSSYSGSSDGEDCTLCSKPPLKRVAAAQ